MMRNHANYFNKVFRSDYYLLLYTLRRVVQPTVLEKLHGTRVVFFEEKNWNHMKADCAYAPMHGIQ